MLLAEVTAVIVSVLRRLLFDGDQGTIVFEEFIE